MGGGFPHDGMGGGQDQDFWGVLCGGGTICLALWVVNVVGDALLP